MSNKKVWWVCEKGPDHIWEADIGSRNAGRGCPFCAGQKASETNSLGSLHPEIATEWHPTLNTQLTPNDLTAGSSLKVWWQCHTNSEHSWQAPPIERVEGHGCPFCSGNRLSPENSLATVAPQLIAEWDNQENFPISPTDVSKGSNTKFWWICSNYPEHRWQATIKSRVNGSGCPECALPLHSSRSEIELFELVEARFPQETVIQHARPIWLGRQHLDIYLPDYNIGIEYHGRQHFEPVSFFGGEEAFKQSLIRDARKAKLCDENDCYLIIVSHGYDPEKIIHLIENTIYKSHKRQ